MNNGIIYHNPICNTHTHTNNNRMHKATAKVFFDDKINYLTRFRAKPKQKKQKITKCEKFKLN